MYGIIKMHLKALGFYLTEQEEEINFGYQNTIGPLTKQSQHYKYFSYLL